MLRHPSEGIVIDFLIEGGIGIADKLFLYFLQDLLLALFQRLHMAIGSYLDDLLDFVNELVETKKGDFVIDPIGLLLMQGLHYLPELPIISFTIILDEFNQVPILEASTHPALLLRVLQHPMSLKDIVVKLSHIQITVLEHLLAHARQLRVYVVTPFQQSQLKLVLLPVGVRIVPASSASPNETKAQSINEAILLEADHQSVALPLRLHKGHLGEIIPHHLCMGAANQEIDFGEVEGSIEDSKVSFFAFVHHVSPAEFGINDRLGDVIEQDRLAIQLPLCRIWQIDQKSFSPVSAFHQFILIEDDRQQSIAIEEDVMPMQEVIVVRSNGRYAVVVEQYPLSLLFEGTDAAHVHRVSVVAVVQRGGRLCPRGTR